MQHSKSPVGSMTMAMKAATAGERGPKVMRLGVLEGARITEERVIREQSAGSTITMGRDPSCTIIVSDEGAPEKVTLFSRDNDRWTLCAIEGLDGRILIDGKVVQLSTLDRSAKIALDEHTRGKLTLGATSVLFQFVEPPPVAPIPQLPRSILRNPLRELDWRYNLSVASFMAMAFVGLGYVEYGYDPEIEAMDIREEVRLVRIDTPAAPEPPAQEAMAAPETPAPNTAPSNTRPQNQNQQHASRNNSAQPSAPRGPSPEDRVAAAQRSAESAVNAALSALQNSREWRDLAHGTGPRSAAAMIANGEGLSSGSVEALANVTGIHNGPSRPGIQRTGLLASNAPGGNSLGGPRRLDGPGDVANNTVTPEERVIRTRVTTSAPVIDDPAPGVPMSEIARVFRNNLGGIQGCYTAALRNNAGLRGRLEVEFTIGTTGRVVGTVDASGIANGDEVHQCVARRVRSYVFPQLQEATNVMFPVSLEPGN